MFYEKVFVEILARFNSNGGIYPLELVWGDGRHFLVDRVLYKDVRPSKAGGVINKCYTVIIEGKERKLYYDKDTERWFVERKRI